MEVGTGVGRARRPRQRPRLSGSRCRKGEAREFSELTSLRACGNTQHFLLGVNRHGTAMQPCSGTAARVWKSTENRAAGNKPARQQSPESAACGAVTGQGPHIWANPCPCPHPPLLGNLGQHLHAEMCALL